MKFGENTNLQTIAYMVTTPLKEDQYSPHISSLQRLSHPPASVDTDPCASSRHVSFAGSSLTSPGFAIKAQKNLKSNSFSFSLSLIFFLSLQSSIQSQVSLQHFQTKFFCSLVPSTLPPSSTASFLLPPSLDFSFSNLWSPFQLLCINPHSTPNTQKCKYCKLKSVREFEFDKESVFQSSLFFKISSVFLRIRNKQTKKTKRTVEQPTLLLCT